MFHLLPQEIFNCVCAYISFDDVISISAVSKDLYSRIDILISYQYTNIYLIKIINSMQKKLVSLESRIISLESSINENNRYRSASPRRLPYTDFYMA